MLQFDLEIEFTKNFTQKRGDYLMEIKKEAKTIVELEREARKYKPKYPWYIAFLKQWDLQLLVVPVFIYVLIFFYGPMYGVIVAFQDFRIGDTFGFSRWVGLDHFRALVSDPFFTRVMRNNIVMGLLRLFIAFPVPIIFALMLNELRSVWFKKSVQTISYLPFFVSWVIISTLMQDFFSPDQGAVNELLMALGVISDPIHFFGEARWFWGLFIGTHVWQTTGFSAIIFVAAITSIDTEQYEAADIDGAGRFAKIWHITLAGIKPTIIILFIMAVGNLMQTSFDQIMQMTNMMGNSALRERADMLSTYAFRMGIGGNRFSFGVAVGVFASSINFILLLTANWVSRRFSETSLF